MGMENRQPIAIDNFPILPYIPPMPADYLTTKQAARLLKCSERTIRNMIERGSIHAEKLDPNVKSRYFIPRSEINSILKLRSKSSSKQ